MDLGTPFGLAFASGLNAYLPLLAFAISARWLRLYHVNPQFAFITQDWFMIALLLLTILDFVADKIPLIDHAWDAIHTFIRPIAGAVVASASIHSAPFTISTASISSSILRTTLTAAGLPATWIILLIALLVGGLLAAMSHTAKATTRLLSTITTAGLFNIGLSIVEDVLVIVAVLLALFVPIVMLILLVLFVIFFGPRLLRLWFKWMSKRSRS